MSALSLPLVALALALLLGAGVIRQGAPMVVSGAAGALVLLPAMGIGLLFRRRILGLCVGLVLWPMAVVAGFPLYFPGERAEALASGATVLMTPLGLRLNSAQAKAVDEFFPGAGPVRPIAPRAEPLEADPVPPPQSMVLVDGVGSGDLVVIPYEGEGQTMTVSVGLEGPKTQADVGMIFDTGATLTTVDHATLTALGVTLSSKSPQVTVRTAGGDRQSHLALLNRLWVGGMEVEGVTVSVCDACADKDAVGLLGMNVSGLFRVTVDSARQELVLQPHKKPRNRVVDVAPWLKLQATATRWEDGRIEVEVRGYNISDRLVKHATVGIRCEDDWTAELGSVPPGGTATAVVSLPVGSLCVDYSIGLERARW